MWVVANINQYYTFRNSIDELFKDETKIYFPKINHEKIIVKNLRIYWEIIFFALTKTLIYRKLKT